MFSIEKLFAATRAALPPEVKTSVFKCRFPGRGFLKRFFNALEAVLYQGDINHITGDVHFLTNFLKKRKTILTIHDCGTLERLCGLKKKLFLFLWYWLPVKRSALVTVISDSTKRELLRYVNIKESKIRVIPDCVFPVFQKNPKPWNTDKPVILQVGISINKNIPRVAKALAGLRCHLRVIGQLGGENVVALENNNIDYSSVAGISDKEMAKEYHNADMLIFVSTNEGFGLPIVEAQATGRPVVTSNISSMPEVAGDAACFVDPHDVADIRRGILRIIQDRVYREKLVELGFKNVERFKPERIAGQYVAVYETLLKN